MKTVLIACALLASTFSAIAQNRTVQVSVFTAKGKPASNVSVSTTSKSTVQRLGKEGTATINAKQENDSLIVYFNNYIGKVPLGEAAEVSLCIDKGSLSKAENNKPTDVTYDVIKLPPFNPDDISSMPDLHIYSDLIALIRAKFPSINITPAGAIITGTASANSQPMALIVVDGSAAQDLSQANGTVSIFDLKSIVVKRSDSLYGIRGAGGIIEITTKRGK